MHRMLLFALLIGCAARRQPEATPPEAALPAASEDANVAVVREQLAPQMQGCFEKRLQEVPGLAGRVVLMMSVVDGAVTTTAIDADDIGDAALSDCLRARAATVSFPANTTLDLYIPFLFQP